MPLNALPVSALMRHTHFGIFAEFLPDKAFRLPRLSRGHSLTERKRTEKSFRPFHSRPTVPFRSGCSFLTVFPGQRHRIPFSVLEAFIYPGDRRRGCAGLFRDLIECMPLIQKIRHFITLDHCGQFFDRAEIIKESVTFLKRSQ